MLSSEQPAYLVGPSTAAAIGKGWPEVVCALPAASARRDGVGGGCCWWTARLLDERSVG